MHPSNLVNAYFLPWSLSSWLICNSLWHSDSYIHFVSTSMRYDPIDIFVIFGNQQHNKAKQEPSTLSKGRNTAPINMTYCGISGQFIVCKTYRKSFQLFEWKYMACPIDNHRTAGSSLQSATWRYVSNCMLFLVSDDLPLRVHTNG